MQARLVLRSAIVSSVLGASSVLVGCGHNAGGTGGSATSSNVASSSVTNSSVATTAASTGVVGSTSSSGGGSGNRVFVTSSKHNGNLGGLAGGDTECQARADAAKLGGTWMAWLADGVQSPSTRFQHSAAPYQRIGGGVIAQNWADLIDGTIGVPINHDETGAPLPAADDMIVWTAVASNGVPTPVNCMGWTNASNINTPGGKADTTDSGWTVTTAYACDGLHRLYCFEQ